VRGDRDLVTDEQEAQRPAWAPPLKPESTPPGERSNNEQV